MSQDRSPSAPSPGPPRLALVVALTLALRVLYLARFGSDEMWMNANYLLQARSLFVKPHLISGPPFADFLIIAFRALGLSGLRALQAEYLVGHGLFAGGVYGLAHGLWPRLSRVRGWALAVLIASLPILSGDDGYDNVGMLLGAALLAVTFALAVRAAEQRQDRKRVLIALFAVATCGAATRTEALLGGLALSLMLYCLGPRIAGFISARRAAATLAVATLAAATVTLITHRLAMGRFELAIPTYGYYTFFGGFPRFLCEGTCPGEYGPYAESVRRFGSFAQNHGSLALALARHPGEAATRLLAKIPEWLSKLSGSHHVGLITFGLALLGALVAFGSRRDGLPLSRRRGVVLFAHAGAALVLFIPPAVPEYFLACLPVILLPAAIGADWLISRLPSRALRPLVALGLAGGLVNALYTGHDFCSVSPLLHEAAAYLEQRCAGGCLMNYPPPHVTAETWVDLQAGMPLPPRSNTDESFVFNALPPAFVDACSFRNRVARARDRGYAGPVLFIQTRTRAPAYSELGFDREHECEGPVDLGRFVLDRRFTDGDDDVSLWSLPPGVLP